MYAQVLHECRPITEKPLIPGHQVVGTIELASIGGAIFLLADSTKAFRTKKSMPP